MRLKTAIAVTPARFAITDISYYNTMAEMQNIISSTTSRRKLGFAWSSLAVLAILGYALIISIACGRRGFFAFDQSIVFDGAWRILCGQKPYRDFVIPFGPLVFWLQAWFFKIGGVNYNAYLAHAAVVNMLVTGAGMLIIRILYPKSRIAVWLSGIITATWFYPQFGTPWPEQTAFACAWGALLTLLLTDFYVSQPKTNNTFADFVKYLAAFISGVFSALAFMAKQNAGLFFLPLPVILLGLQYFCTPQVHRRLALIRICMLWVAGLLCAIITGALWVWIASDWSAFYEQFFVIPAELGRSRLLSVDRLLVKLFVTASWQQIAWRLAVTLAGGLLLLAAGLLWLRDYRQSKRMRIGLIIAIYAFCYQQLYYLSSYNAYTNAQPFLGLIIGIIGAEFLSYGFVSQRALQKTLIYFKSLLLIVCAALVITGCYTGLSRRAQDVFVQSRFKTISQTPAMRALLWGDPTLIENTSVTRSDFDDLMQFLQEQNKNFFIFPDFTICYGLAGRTSPQPWLWFHKGLTYPLVYRRDLDQRLVDSLQASEVQLVVLEQASFFGSWNRLADFPLLRHWIETHTVIKTAFGIFTIREVKNMR